MLLMTPATASSLLRAASASCRRACSCCSLSSSPNSSDGGGEHPAGPLALLDASVRLVRQPPARDEPADLLGELFLSSGQLLELGAERL